MAIAPPVPSDCSTTQTLNAASGPPTAEGWLYLAVVEDVFTRQIVGWSMSGSRKSRLVVDALEMAVQRELPGEGLVAHSDHGVQYASDHDQELLSKPEITCPIRRSPVTPFPRPRIVGKSNI
jgi:transposase InsO family protein